MSNLTSGTYVVGKCLGIKDNTRTLPSGDSMREVFVGISYPVSQGYEGQEVIVDVKMSRAAMDNGDFRQFEKLLQKQIAVPVNNMSRAYNGKAYTTNYFDNRRGVVVLGPQS